ncbi:aldehyde dehydrogenase family protein [Bradyrhizobium yuanmingense]|nr:aldehyde dehydrogenase family protein [Bradyrhizobium yuanmingense]MDF0498854.1 aldehyde dehydrogenase family protein [Bradyrhizobium yuanmingense]
MSTSDITKAVEAAERVSGLGKSERQAAGTEAGVVQEPLTKMKAIEKSRSISRTWGGAKVVTGGKRHALDGSFFGPTVLANVGPDALVAHELAFGPLGPVSRFKDEEDVIAMCNDWPFDRSISLPVSNLATSAASGAL